MKRDGYYRSLSADGSMGGVTRRQAATVVRSDSPPEVQHLAEVTALVLDMTRRSACHLIGSIKGI